MKLIFIHGRAQQGKDKETLRMQWINTLEKGLEKSKLKLPIDKKDILFPYYGNKLIELMGKRIGLSSKTTDEETLFTQRVLEEVGKNAPDKEGKKITKFQPHKKGIENWEIVQDLLEFIDENTPWGSLAISLFTKDVYQYLTKPSIRTAVNNIVSSAIPLGEPCVVVGHSLGTVVGYDVLSALSKFNVKRYITVGSPLGMKSINEYLKQPFHIPPCVSGGWYNAYDERDVVALNPLDKTHFNTSPPIVNTNKVRNQTKNRHGIVGYLNDKEVAQQVYDALTKD